MRRQQFFIVFSKTYSASLSACLLAGRRRPVQVTNMWYTRSFRKTVHWGREERSLDGDPISLLEPRLTCRAGYIISASQIPWRRDIMRASSRRRSFFAFRCPLVRCTFSVQKGFLGPDLSGGSEPMFELVPPLEPEGCGAPAAFLRSKWLTEGKTFSAICSAPRSSWGMVGSPFQMMA